MQGQLSWRATSIPDTESALPSKRLVGELQAINPRPRRALATPGEQLVDGLTRSLRHDLDGPIGSVPNPTTHAQPTCDLLARIAKEDTLDATPHDHPATNLGHDHALASALAARAVMSAARPLPRIGRERSGIDQAGRDERRPGNDVIQCRPTRGDQ